MEEDKEFFPTTPRSDGVKRFFTLPEKQPLSRGMAVLYSIGYVVDKCITVLLIVLWPLLTLLTWASYCYFNVRTRQWVCMEKDDQPLVDLRGGDGSDFVEALFITFLGNIAVGGCLASLLAVGCWMWDHPRISAVILGSTAVVVALSYCEHVYLKNKGMKHV